MQIKRALISVSNKEGVVEFARQLHEAGVEIISTGGTMKAIKEAGIPVTYVSDVTGFPEIMDGRVKTLNPYRWYPRGAGQCRTCGADGKTWHQGH